MTKTVPTLSHQPPQIEFILRNIAAIRQLRSRKRSGSGQVGASLADFKEAYEEAFGAMYPLAKTLRAMVEEKRIIGVVTVTESRPGQPDYATTKRLLSTFPDPADIRMAQGRETVLPYRFYLPEALSREVRMLQTRRKT